MFLSAALLGWTDNLPRTYFFNH